MKQSIFFSQANLMSERWRHAFQDAIITDESGEKLVVGQHTLCWVVTNLPDWEQRIQRLSQQGITVVTLSVKESRAELLTALGSGARGYAHALATSETLIAVAASVINGGLWLGSDFVRDLIKGINVTRSDSSPRESSPATTLLANGGSSSVLDRLTAREREVCTLVARAYSNKEVARFLNVTERTVKAHLGAAFEKLQIRDRVQLTVLINRLNGAASEAQEPPPPRVQNG